MSKRRCVVCGRDPAAGFASIGDDFYCHGYDDEVPTCYMRSQGDYLKGGALTEPDGSTGVARPDGDDPRGPKL